MNGTAFPQQNLNLGAGNNPNTVDLPVAICSHPGYEEVAFIFSCHKLSAEELKQINETGHIWLGIMTTEPRPHPDPMMRENGKMIMRGTQPPVILMTENPFTQMDPPYKPYDAEAFIYLPEGPPY